MRTEQPAVLTKHRKTPDSALHSKQSEKYAPESEKNRLSLSTTVEERRSILGWPKPPVSRTAVTKSCSTTGTDSPAAVDEKVEGSTPMQNGINSGLWSPQLLAHQLSDSANANNDSNPGSGGHHFTAEPPGVAPDVASKAIQTVIPVVSIDKPLPPCPMSSLLADTVRSATLSDSDDNSYRTNSNERLAKVEPSANPPAVRRVKSYGDLLSPPFLQARPTGVERRASHNELRGRDAAPSVPGPSNEVTQHNAANVQDGMDYLSPSEYKVSQPAGSFRGSILKKRSSSLGFGRRPSATSTETIKAGGQQDQEPKIPVTTRNVSSATAPASTGALDADVSRKRKPSMFGGLFSGLWRAKPRDTVSVSSEATTSIAEPLEKPAEATNPGAEGKHNREARPARASSCSSNSSSIVEHEASSQPHSTLTVLQPSSESHTSTTSSPPAAVQPHPRRYSIIHNFFRSTSTSKAASNADDGMANHAMQVRSGHSSTIEDTSPLVHQPIDIPNSSLPQLPSISRDLGDISFGSLFEGAERRSRGRSRASTRGSLQSLFSTSPQAPSHHRDSSPTGSPKVGSPRLRSNSQLQVSVTASDLASGRSGQEESGESQTVADRAEVTFEGSSGVPYVRERPRSPVINGIIAAERRRTRLFRSNSASSVSVTPWSTFSSETSRPESKASRPTFGRARSSSTVSTSTATRALSPLLEGIPVDSIANKSMSPAILVTSDQQTQSPYFNGIHAQTYRTPAESPMEMDCELQNRASRSSSVSTGFASPSLPQDHFLTSSSPHTESDANLADALSDFILTPTMTFDMRMSGDSHRSGRSSFSAASSLLSSSPASSTVGGQQGRASSIMHKSLRRRANTLGSILATSAPNHAHLEAHDSKTSGTSSLEPVQVYNRQGRSGSSSRLSAFFGSASTLSSSPVESSGVWLTPQPPTNSPTAMERDCGPVRSIARRLSSSFRGSPTLLAEEVWSNASSPLMPAESFPTPDVEKFQVHSGPSTYSASNIPDKTDTSIANYSLSNLDASQGTRIQVMPEDTPVTFLARVKRLASPQNIAGQLSERTALRLFLEEFDFVNDPIDVAIRTLLLKVHLPRETQQIDRVMEAFAERYHLCNPALFTSPDQPYILAFSIIMLQTDAFNRSNKKKMTRADYVKNTKVDGVSSILLEYIYDNVTYAPFIYADSYVEVLGAKKPGDTSHVGSTLGNPGSKERNKLEVYRNIAGKDLMHFRVDMGLLVPIKNPFSYTGTVAFFDCSALRNAFVFAHLLKLPDTPFQEAPPTEQSKADCASLLRVTRVGVLERKNDIGDTGKKASSRKWKSWGVILTEGQLLLFRDAGIASDLRGRLLESAGADLPQSADQSACLAWTTDFKPDEILSLADTIVLYDFTYTRYTHVFRCIQPNGRQILFRASDEVDLNLWMSTINYAATFRTAGIKMRMPSQVEDKGRLSVPPANLPQEGPRDISKTKLSSATSISATSSYASDFEAEHPEIGPLLKAVRPSDGDQAHDMMFPHSLGSDLRPLKRVMPPSNWHIARGDIERSKIMDLETTIREEQTALASDIRLVRNIAILTPFTASGRQRLQQAAQAVARRIRQTRQNIAKVICYRECLCRDLLALERDANRQRFHQSTSSSHGNLRLAHADFMRQDSARSEGTGRLVELTPREQSESTQMLKSASQDEIATLVRSPSLLKRSLTADIQHSTQKASFDRLG